MPDFYRQLTEKEFKHRFETQLHEITADIILSDENTNIDEVFIDEIVRESLDIGGEIWHDATHDSIATHADNRRFDPYEELNLAAPANDIIRSTAYRTLQTKLTKHLGENKDNLERAHIIHLYLKELIDGGVETPKKPSLLLSSFNKWLVEQFATENTVASPFDYDDFNEQHIRGIQAIDIETNELVDYLWNWLSDTHNDFPDRIINA